MADMNNNAITVPLYTAELLRVTLGLLCERQHPLAGLVRQVLAEHDAVVAEYLTDWYGPDVLDQSHDITMQAADRVGDLAVRESGNAPGAGSR